MKGMIASIRIPPPLPPSFIAYCCVIVWRSIICGYLVDWVKSSKITIENSVDSLLCMKVQGLAEKPDDF